MTKKPGRDNAYYLKVLERDHPVIFDDYRAGGYPTVAKALVAAGLKSQRTPLQEMLNAWKKASTAEQAAFRSAIGATATSTLTPGSVTTSRGPFSADRRLQPEAVKVIMEIMTRRGLTAGDVMDEVGRKRLNPSLGLALRQGARMQQDLIDDLEIWVNDQ